MVRATTRLQRPPVSKRRCALGERAAPRRQLQRNMDQQEAGLEPSHKCLLRARRRLVTLSGRQWVMEKWTLYAQAHLLVTCPENLGLRVLPRESLLKRAMSNLDRLL